MIEANELHPSPEMLSDFALGKLGEEQIPIVAQHLSDCAACRDTAVAATDSFLELLRPDANAAPDSAALPVPLRHHCRYRVIRCLGRGGMGTVYLAEHRLMRQQRAIKIINPALLGNDSAVERFVREVELLPRLRHPHIVQAHDAEKVADLYLLVMEYIEGQTLAEVVEREGPLPIRTACEYARQAALGLQHAHEQGLVHRDIKPANLMRTSAGQIKILDFGLARPASKSGSDAGLTHEHAAMGTPDYLAPEQALDARNADIRADIYSLGCTLFYLLTGSPLFAKPSPLAVFAAHLHEPPPALCELRPDVPDVLGDLVQHMLSKLPNQRPQTPAEVAECLEQFAAPPTASSSTGNVPTEQPMRRHRWPWKAVALIMLPMIALLILWGAGILRVRTRDGIIVLEGLPDEVEVFVDGRKVDLLLPGDKKPVRIEAPPGKHQLKITKGDFEPFAKELTLASGRAETVTIRLQRAKKEEAKPSKGDEKGWGSLFNGKDLTGWKTFDGGTGGWKVEEGAIVGRGDLPVLFTNSNAFEDFHLRVEATINEGGSGGILFRSPFVPYGPHAYHARIGLANRFAQQTGSLSDLRSFYRKLHKPNEWFTLEVIARGERIVIKLNGETTVDLKDTRFQKGHIDLEAKHPLTVVKFRKIEVKKLPPPDEP